MAALSDDTRYEIVQSCFRGRFKYIRSYDAACSTFLGMSKSSTTRVGKVRGDARLVFGSQRIRPDFLQRFFRVPLQSL